MGQNIDIMTGVPLQPIIQAGREMSSVTLLPTNTTTTGQGTAQAINNFTTMRLEVWGTGTYSLQVQVNMANGSQTFSTIQPISLATMSTVTSITTAGMYEVDVTGFSNVCINVVSITGGNVNVAGKWVA